MIGRRVRGWAGRAICAPLAVCALWLAALWGPAAASSPPAATLTAGDSPQDLTPAARQWFDASGERSLADWLQQFNNNAASPQGGSAAGFTWLDAKTPLGRGTGAVWVAVPLHNPQAALLRHLVVTPLRLEQADAWLLSGPPGAAPQPLGRSGLGVALADRPLLAITPAWALTLPPGDSTLLLRIQSRTPMVPQLSLWSPSAQLLAERQNDLRQGLQAGSLALAALLALMFALWLRESTWAWYGAASISTVVYQACFSGMALLWLWPAHPQWTLPGLALALAGAHLSWVLFFLNFTPPAGQPAWARRTASALAGVSLLGLGLVLVQGYAVGIAVQEVAGLLLPLVLPWLAWRAWRSGDQPARFLLLSYGMLAAATMLRVAVVRGWMTAAPWLENWLLPLAATLTSAVMMLALADRLRQMDRQQVLQARLHQATLQTRIQEATTELVQARDVAQTAVQFKARFLARVSHDLRTPLHTLLGNTALARRFLHQWQATGLATDKEQLQESLRSGRDMLQLSDELLELTRGEAGHLTLTSLPAHLPTLAQEIASSARWPGQPAATGV